MSEKHVLDTNVVISGVISPGPPQDVLTANLSESGPTPIISKPILDEYERKLRQIGRVTARDRLRAMGLLRLHSEVVVPEESLSVVADDPDDDKFFEAAVAADADYIVSGDGHALSIESYEGVETISPRDMADRLE